MQREDKELLGVALAVLRTSLRLQQGEVAQAAAIPPSSISEYEGGKMMPGRRTLARICQGMGLPPSALEAALGFVDMVHEARESSSAAEALACYHASKNIFLSTLELLQVETSKSPRVSCGIHDVEELGSRLWERLSPYEANEQRAIACENSEFHQWPLCTFLCQLSEQAAANDWKRAVELAELSLLISYRVPGDESWRSHLQSYTWAFVGNAQRVGGNLSAADEAFARSRRLWNTGISERADLLDESRRLDLEASLRREQRRFSEALQLLSEAFMLSRSEAAGRILIKKAKTLEEMGDFEGALATLRQAAPLVSGETNPRDLLCLHYNVLVYLERLGRSEEASGLIPEVRILTERLGKDLDQVRLRWLEGLIAASLGRREEGLAAVREARDEFARRGIAYDSALATLELAVFCLEDGNTGEVKVLAEEMAPIFKAQGVDREALAALRLFREAAEREEATLEMARQALECLRRAGR